MRSILKLLENRADKKTVSRVFIGSSESWSPSETRGYVALGRGTSGTKSRGDRLQTAMGETRPGMRPVLASRPALRRGFDVRTARNAVAQGVGRTYELKG